ncbi:TorD/DmsD family molecular chaperone [Aggregatilinea lenta]|uniref:TorD/DmsD family molecular chaperone n=1 Tax=Aggregatilinea lenta TaxID=913108 RepID=UPI000E5AF4DF|nr:molecular chaperone TorD family protein [Aggregatilinea lenta]
MNDHSADMMMPDPKARAFEILARVAGFRSMVYGWLALSFYPPDEPLVSALASGSLVAELSTLTSWLGADQARLQPGIDALAQFAGVTMEALQETYQRCFGKSVRRISPRESTYCWRDASDVLGAREDLAHVLLQQYRQFGVVPQPGQEDHVAVELELLAYLCEREATSWKAGRAEEAKQMRRQQRNFLDDHLGRWLPEFSWQLSSVMRGSFYANQAVLADTWLEMEYGPGYTAVGA